MLEPNKTILGDEGGLIEIFSNKQTKTEREWGGGGGGGGVKAMEKE